jgi:hypothetical protein
MAQFNIHSPKTQGDMKSIREASRKQVLPIGLISENRNFAYGYDGDKYYVTESIGYLVTRMQLAFEEAKQLFNALTFVEASEPKSDTINSLVKSSRKQDLSGDNLFWFYVDGLCTTP